MQSTLRIGGHFDVAHGGAFRGITANSAHSDFTYSNMVWTLPNLIALRPEGRVEAFNSSDDRSKDFYWRLVSSILAGACAGGKGVSRNRATGAKTSAAEVSPIRQS